MDAKFNIGFQGSNLEGGYDGNADGENSVSLKLNLAEVLDELKKNGSAEIEAKKIKIEMDGAKIKVLVDTNKDGENVFEFQADLLEGLQEADILS